MNRRALAVRLSALIALSGVLPIALLATAAVEVMRRSGEQASVEALAAVATQASSRIGSWAAQQREMLRAIAMAVGNERDASRKLADVSLDAPSLGRVQLIDASTPREELPSALGPQKIVRALQGIEVASETYVVDLSPAMDVCVPAGVPGKAVCATLDLLELQRLVQRIRVGETGYALAFDRSGRLVASGAGGLRAAVLTGERVPEAEPALALAGGTPGPGRLRNKLGEEVLAGWSHLPDLGWTIAVEQPTREALRGARTALTTLGLGAIAAAVISLLLGAAQARRVLGALEVEERWKTAGRIASGITHDLGHRLAILQQTASLAEQNDPTWLPLIRDNLQAEVRTLRKFVADFADLTREAKPADFLPLELNAFAESLRRTAQPHGDNAKVRIRVLPHEGEIWVRGDRYLLERAALNLAYNAIEASRTGSEVSIRVARNGEHALVEVEDKGTGIPADRISLLFDSFSSTKRTGAHVGMGLPNVRRIVTAHGGTVSVRSTPGEGSTFTIELPLQRPGA